jgi:parallel beta-helix repeat protein
VVDNAVGNDGPSSPGTSIAPFATIRRAVEVVRAGDHVLVRRGTGVYREIVEFTQSGTADAPIVFEAEPGVVVIPPHAVGDVGALNILGLTDITLRGFTTGAADGSTYAQITSFFGISVEASQRIVLENNHTRRTASSGMRIVDSSDIQVIGNTIEKSNAGPASFYPMDSGATRPTLPADASCAGRWEWEKTHRAVDEALSISGTDGLRVIDNVVFNHDSPSSPWQINNACVIGKEGITVKQGGNDGEISGNEVYGLSKVGIYVGASDRSPHHILIAGNRVHDTRYGISVGGEYEAATLNDVLVVNNLVYRNERTGIVVSNWGGKDSAGKPIVSTLWDIKIINNTAVANGTAADSEESGGIGVATPAAYGVALVNNLSAYNQSSQFRDQDANPVSVVLGNLAYGAPLGNLATDRAETEVRVGDPAFVEPSTDDYQLGSGSAALDAGFASRVERAVVVPGQGNVDITVDVPTMAPSDFAGTRRPRGSTFDIGALETQ